jgi:hypothetical protein
VLVVKQSERKFSAEIQAFCFIGQFQKIEHEAPIRTGPSVRSEAAVQFCVSPAEARARRFMLMPRLESVNDVVIVSMDQERRAKIICPV